MSNYYERAGDLYDARRQAAKRRARTLANTALRLNHEQAKALRELVRYVYKDEARSYAEDDADGRRNHIFTDIRTLALACGHVSAEDLTAFDADLAAEEV